MDINGKPTCLICNIPIAVAKEYNVKRYYETIHAAKFSQYSDKLRENKINALELALKKQQSIFKRVNEVSDAAVKATYKIAYEIAVSSKSFSEGDFIKKFV